MVTPFAGRIVLPCLYRITLAALLAATAIGPTRADIPHTLSFQGVLSDATGKPKANATYSVTFRLYDALTGGNLLWTEAAKPVAVTGGRGAFSILLGTPTSFGTLPFDRPYFLEVQVSGEAAMTPRLPLRSAAYALNAWSTGGNGGTNPATQFLGTTDNKPLVLKANGRTVLRLEDKADAGNTYHTVNVLAGAASNRIEPGVVGATIGGGGQDSNSGADSPNDVRGSFGTIGGGSGNFIDAFPFVTIGGGAGNIAQGGHSTISGGSGNNTQAQYTTIAGGSQNFISGLSSTIGGGTSNSVTGSLGTVAGGNENSIAGSAAAIGGGQSNTASAVYSVVAGGYQNVNAAQYGVLGGGAQNVVEGFLAAIAGGSQNKAPGQYAAIGGGSRNQASADTATISGGDQNVVNGTFSTIAGGRLNYGWSTSDFSTVGGGFSNTIYGDYATIPGGFKNYADGLASLAAGYRGYAAHDGSFVWADAHEADFISTAANQFCVRASGGLVLETFSNVPIYTGVGTSEANRFVMLLNSPRAPSASGLKAGGILCSDAFSYANPGKNNMVVKGTLGVGYPDPAPYTFAVAGTTYSQGGYSSSDARYKRNVNTLDNAMASVLSLRGVSFEWDRDTWKEEHFAAGRQIGFIAQEVESVLPETVSTDARGFKAVSYQNIVPVLVEAVKTLKADTDRKLTEKDAQIAALQKQYAALEERLRRLEQSAPRTGPAGRP